MDANPRLKLQLEAWVTACNKVGYATPIERGRAIGVDRSTISRVEREIIQPSGPFIAAVLHLFGSDRFDEFFTVCDAKAAA